MSCWEARRRRCWLTPIFRFWSSAEPIAASPIITIKADRVVANSRDVAAYFNKRHDHVLRDIDALRQRLPEFAAPNFGAGSYMDANNQSRRCADMTRDGFTFLAMGFTRAKADAFKLAYLNEYNRIEEELRKRAQQSIPTDYASALRLAADEHEKRLKLEAEKEALEARAAEDAPKVKNWEAFHDTGATTTTGTLAKEMGFRSAQALHTFLHEEGVIFPRKDRPPSGLHLA
ncbi:Rha family transcriptional regulator [Camelimonas sp. ID_303_24]